MIFRILFSVLSVLYFSSTVFALDGTVIPNFMNMVGPQPVYANELFRVTIQVRSYPSRLLVDEFNEDYTQVLKSHVFSITSGEDFDAEEANVQLNPLSRQIAIGYENHFILLDLQTEQITRYQVKNANGPGPRFRDFGFIDKSNIFHETGGKNGFEIVNTDTGETLHVEIKSSESTCFLVGRLQKSDFTTPYVEIGCDPYDTANNPLESYYYSLPNGKLIFSHQRPIGGLDEPEGVLGFDPLRQRTLIYKKTDVFGMYRFSLIDNRSQKEIYTQAASGAQLNAQSGLLTIEYYDRNRRNSYTHLKIDSKGDILASIPDVSHGLGIVSENYVCARPRTEALHCFEFGTGHFVQIPDYTWLYVFEGTGMPYRRYRYDILNLSSLFSRDYYDKNHKFYDFKLKKWFTGHPLGSTDYYYVYADDSGNYTDVTLFKKQ